MRFFLNFSEMEGDSHKPLPLNTVVFFCPRYRFIIGGEGRSLKYIEWEGGIGSYHET